MFSEWVIDRLSGYARVGKWSWVLLVCGGLAGAAVGSAWAGPMFSAPLSFDVGIDPVSVAIGDVSGDGKPDLVTANINDTNVSVLLGNGDGTFQTKVNYGTGDAPYSVAIGDLSGDGKPDLVTANLNTTTVSVLLGNGDGTFQTKVDYGTGVGPQSVAIGDVSGDGKPDLVTANSLVTTVSVLLGNGDGTFQTKVDYGTGIRPQFSRDRGRERRRKAGSRDGECQRQHRVGPLGEWERHVPDEGGLRDGAAPVSVAIGEVSGDGKPDLVTANANDASVSVLLGNGDGSFQSNVDYGTGDLPLSVAIGDVSGDGKLDLATANSNASTVSVLLGNGDGTFQTKVDYWAGGGHQSVAIGDVSGDGKPDLATTNVLGSGSSSGTVSVLLGIGDGTFQTQVDYGTGAAPYSVAIGDVSGDGKPIS